MRLHIPAHLEKFELVANLKKLLIKYSEENTTTEITNFSGYFYKQSIDPVKKFIELTLDESLIGEADFDSLTDYYTAKFFSLRGTNKIFEYLDEIKSILGITLLEYRYDNVTDIDIEFELVETQDINLFVSSAKNFFDSLLYYNEYEDIIHSMKLNVTTVLNIAASEGIASYSKFEVTEEETEQ